MREPFRIISAALFAGRAAVTAGLTLGGLITRHMNKPDGKHEQLPEEGERHAHQSDGLGQRAR